MKGIRRFFSQASITYKSLFGIMDIRLYLLARIITPIVSMLFFCYLAMHAYGKENIAPWVIGNAFATCIFPVFLGAGLVLRIERGIGTLKAIIATPTSRIVIFVSRSLMHIVDAIVISVISITVGILIFDLHFSNVNIAAFALTIVTSMFAAIALGMVISSMGLVVRDVHMIMNVGMLGLIILSGANVATDNFPFFLRILSRALPVSRGIEAGRLLYSGGNMQHFYQLIGQEFLLGVFYMFLGFMMYMFFEYQARKHATLDFY